MAYQLERVGWFFRADVHLQLEVHEFFATT
jgi:hypothetical protein